jgi:hypothetical protein
MATSLICWKAALPSPKNARRISMAGMIRQIGIDYPK